MRPVELRQRRADPFDALRSGMDRHLLGLRAMLPGSGLDMPALFADPLFARLQTYQLSTSQARRRDRAGGSHRRGPVRHVARALARR